MKRRRATTRRRYFDCRVASKSGGIRGPDGVYRTLAGRVVGIEAMCEHCDSEQSPKVRVDPLRGFVCPPCDSVLDEMLGESL